MGFEPEEIRATYDRYVALRDRVEAGEAGWDELAGFFTEDAVFIDPAWGRIEGRPAIRQFLIDSMTGLEDWSFPRFLTGVEDDRLVSGWMNRLPGERPDGSHFEAPGFSIMTYEGDGLFRREEDVLNMTHVFELIRESGWKPGPGAKPPPRNPTR